MPYHYVRQSAGSPQATSITPATTRRWTTRKRLPTSKPGWISVVRAGTKKGPEGPDFNDLQNSL